MALKRTGKGERETKEGMFKGKGKWEGVLKGKRKWGRLEGKEKR